MPVILPKHGSIKSMLEYNTKSNYFSRAELVDLWELKSGTGVLTFNSSILEPNKSGFGRFEIVGTGVFELDILLPVNVDVGLGGVISLGADAAGTNVSIGYSGFNNAGVSIGNKNFIADNLALTAISSFEYAEGYVVDEGADPDNFLNATRFVKPRIEVISNPVKVYFNGFNLWPMGAAKIALWT